MTAETITDRISRLNHETSVAADTLRQTKDVKPSSTLFARTGLKFFGRWVLGIGPFRGHVWTVKLACDVLTPLLANLKAELEPDPGAQLSNPYVDPLPPRAERPNATAPKLSAVVSVHNEEDKLAACLGRLGFADEIAVLLDKCTDGSEVIARNYADRVIEGNFTIEGERRNAAIAACRGDWILEVDADEHVTPELGVEIERTIATSDFDWHEILVDNVIGETLVRNGWGASYGKAAYPGLFRRGTKKWGHQRVHPSLTWTAPRGRGPMLEHRVVHYIDRHVSDMIRRLNSYASARCSDLVESGRVDYLPGNIRRFISRFHKCYVRRGGRKEGGYGFLIALFAGLYPIVSYAKSCEYRRAVRKSQ